MDFYRHMVISGGSLKVLSVIGCLKYLSEKNLMDNIITFVGTSGGSILCLMLVCGFDIVEMIDFLYHKINDESLLQFKAEECLEIFNTFGINSGQIIIDVVEAILMKKFNKKDMTFMELGKQTGKDLVVTVSNLTTEKCEFFSMNTKPNMSIVTAIRISCSVPMIFSPVVIDNQIYVDGGIFNNFPINYFDNETIKDVIGINVFYSNYKKTNDFVEYFMMIINSMINKVNESERRSDKKKLDHNIIVLDFEDDDWFSFTDLKIKKLSKQMWVNLIQKGYNAINEQYQSLEIQQELQEIQELQTIPACENKLHTGNDDII